MEYISNSILFRSLLDFCFEFLPMLTFMLSFVGYLDYLIVYKWITPSISTSTNFNKPSLIQTLLEWMMPPFGIPAGQQLYEGQQSVQKVLFKVDIFCLLHYILLFI